MKNESRVQKSIMNAKVNLIYYFLFIVLSFFSRKIFLDSLGAEFTGLQGTIQSILGYLNLAEFGISTAISFNLYKPIREGDKEKIKELISLFGYIYRFVGSIVLLAGLVLAIFLPFIFKDSGFSNSIIILCYLSFLLSSLYGYFLNYKQILLAADQKTYIITKYYQGAQFVAVLIQMAFAYYWRSYIGVILTQMVYGITYCYILENRLSKEYPWFKVDLKQGKKLISNYPHIIKSTKQVFVHRFKDFMLSKSDQLFVYVFADLKIVAYYGNYALIFVKLQQLITTALDGMSASVGNLVAEGNTSRTMTVFWELITLRYFISGASAYCVCILVQPFICLWLGREYLLGWDVIFFLVANYYISQTRGVVDMFNNAYGHYADVWAAWVELALFIGITIFAGLKWGFVGVLIGKFFSVAPIVVFWKSFYLFKDGFKLPYLTYWKGIARHLAVLFCSIIFTTWVIKTIHINPYSGYVQFIVYSLISTILFLSLYIPLNVIFVPGAKDLLKRVPIVQKIRNRF